jgi:predicted nucleotidyltransferase
MIAQIVTDKLPEIRAACEKHKVRNLWLFGSATTDEFDPATSDLDFLVEFEAGIDHGLDGEYFLLLEAIRALFRCDVDLFERRVVERDPNYIRRDSILKGATGPIYAAA